jgi:hypothetical protein
MVKGTTCAFRARTFESSSLSILTSFYDFRKGGRVAYCVRFENECSSWEPGVRISPFPPKIIDI